MLPNAPRIFRHPRVAYVARGFIGALAALTAVLASSQSTTATTPLMTWNAASDFSAINNPNGSWSYGWSTDRLSPFNTYTTTTVSSGLDIWTSNPTGDLTPEVIYNPTGSTIFPNQSNFFPAGTLAFHPGSAGQNSIVRWTAPNNGRYDINATFSLRDNHPTTTDVAVLISGVQQFAGAIDGVNTSQNFAQTGVVLSLGETVDFHVGFGSDGDYFFDATGLDAIISQEGLSASGIAVGAREGAPFSGPVAVVTDGNFDDRPAIFTASIDWGDGTPATSGLIAGGGGTLIIRGSHTYAEEGAYSATVTVNRPGGASASTSTTAIVTDPPVLVTGGVTVNAQEGSSSGAQMVATFTDPGGAESIGDYAAIVDWGDGQTSPGTIAFSNGVFAVDGAHTYAEEGAYAVTVKVLHDVATSVTATSTATVSDPSMTGAGVSVAATEGVPSGPVTVATFTDPAGAEAATDYAATVNWGDNTTSAGTVAFDTNLLTFTVQGNHQYAEEGAYPITVTLHHDQAADVIVSATATVTDVSAVPTGGLTVTSVEGTQSGLQPVALFVDPAGSEAIGDYAATIDWGDGGPAGAGTIVATAGGFTVLGSHAYAEEGFYAVTVTIHHDPAPDATVTSGAVVVDAALTSAGGLSITGAEGSDTGVQTVANFTDPGGAEPLSDYTATINWGDGQASAGVITLSNNVFSVAGSHTYVEEGAYPVTVSLAHDALPAVIVSSTAAISDPAVEGAAVNVTATEGVSSGAVTVAAFTDPGGAENAADYAATIDWGDGTTSAGAITPTGGAFSVSGSHSYAEEGSHTLTVTLNHDSAAPVTVTSTATVTDPSVTASAGAPISAAESASTGPVTLATFTDPAGAEAITDYSATVDWGDGTTSAGTIAASGGIFGVSGDHVYTEEGAFAITVTIHHDGAADVSVTDTATVSNPPLSITAGNTVSAQEGADTGAQTVATFTDPGGVEPVSDYQASIDWGDGSTSTGTVTAAGSGFAVTGDHIYAEEGAYTVVVTITDDSTSGQAATVSAQVSDQELQGTPLNLSATEGAATGPIPVATFTDPGGAENLAHYTATIDWGDGTTSAGAITANGTSFTVTGDHTYAQEGPFPVSVNVQHDGAGGILLRANATVSDAALTAGAPNIGTAVEGGASPTSLSVPFSDANPAAVQSEFAATINWGDGTTSAGTIVPSGSSWVAQASHQYGDEGTYPVTITIGDAGGSAASASGTTAVADAPVTPGAPSSIDANEGASFSGPVASYTDANGAATAADLTASIDWGDGSTSAGTVAVGAGGVVVVSGTHTYGEEGQFQLNVNLEDDGGSMAALGGTATVGDPPVAAAGGFSVTGTQQVDTGSQIVASFTDPGGAEPNGADPTGVHYTASIAWGDGSASAGVVGGPGAGGAFTVTGDHVYATGGQFTVTVTVHHESAPDATATSAATITARTANAQIIFSRAALGDDRGTHIDEVEPDGTQLQALAPTASADSTPAWSADGTHIAFSSNRSGFLHIYTMDSTGANVVQLTSGPYLDTLPSWSPDGTMIAFTSNRDGSLHIFTVNVASKVITQLTTGSSIDEHPAWSPDGAHILFTSTRAGGVFTHIYVMKADGTGVQALTSGTFFDDGANWSPDGARIVFASTRGGGSHIYVMNADGTAVTALTSAAPPDTQPVWSPDGRFIAFVSVRSGLLHIYVMNADGTGITAVTSGTSFDTFPSWRSA